MLSSHSINIFTTLIDKVGVEPIFDCLTSSNSNIQQTMLTMIAMLANDSNLKSIPEKVSFFFKLILIYLFKI